MLCVASSQHWPTPTYLEGKAPHSIHRRQAGWERDWLTEPHFILVVGQHKSKNVVQTQHPAAVHRGGTQLEAAVRSQKARGEAEALAVSKA